MSYILVFLLSFYLVLPSLAFAGLSPAYIIKSAKNGDTAAQIFLAEKYYHGKDLEQDYTQALYWYKKAAETGEPDAEYMVGDILFKGLGVNKDERLAVSHFQSAAKNGHAQAQFMLARCYSEGIGIKQNASEALAWYQKAAASGYEAAKDAVHHQTFFSKLELEFSKSYEHSSSFSRLSRYQSFRGYRWLNEKDKELADRKLIEFIRDRAVPVIKKEFSNAQDENLYEVVFWRKTRPFINSRLSDDDVITLDRLAEDNVNRITAVIVTKRRQEYQRRVLSQGQSLQALKASVAFEKEQLGELYNLSQFHQLNQERRQHRASLYSLLAADLTAMASRAKYVTEVNQLEGNYIFPGDAEQHQTKQIMARLDAVKEVFTPFKGLPGGEYLNALYGGDWKQLKKFDKAYMEPYMKGYLGQSLALYGGLIDSFSAMAGKKSTVGKDLYREVANSSLIIPILTTYLVNYDSVYKACLRADAVQFKKTVASEVVYKNGFGNRVGGYRNPDKISYFSVNKEFGDIFRKVGLNESNSGNARFIESLFNPDSSASNNLSGVIEGTGEVMSKFMCNDNKIKRLENHMIKYFSM